MSRFSCQSGIFCLGRRALTAWVRSILLHMIRYFKIMIHSIYAFLYFVMFSLLTCYDFSWLKICPVVVKKELANKWFTCYSWSLSFSFDHHTSNGEALGRMIDTSAGKPLLLRTRMKCQFLCRSARGSYLEITSRNSISQVKIVSRVILTLKSPELLLSCKIKRILSILWSVKCLFFCTNTSMG